MTNTQRESGHSWLIVDDLTRNIFEHPIPGKIFDYHTIDEKTF